MCVHSIWQRTEPGQAVHQWSRLCNGMLRTELPHTVMEQSSWRKAGPERVAFKFSANSCAECANIQFWNLLKIWQTSFINHHYPHTALHLKKTNHIFFSCGRCENQTWKYLERIIRGEIFGENYSRRIIREELLWEKCLGKIIWGELLGKNYYGRNIRGETFGENHSWRIIRGEYLGRISRRNIWRELLGKNYYGKILGKKYLGRIIRGEFLGNNY